MELRDGMTALQCAYPDARAGDVDLARLKALRDARVRALLASRSPGGSPRAEARESRR